MNYFLLFAILAPLTWAFVNFFDAYVTKNKVKSVSGFIALNGLLYLILGLIFALFLDWYNYSFYQLVFPALGGVMIGIQTYIYYYVLSKHDVSNAVGLFYIYPLIVALLSFLFLNEKLSFLGYFGILLTLTGVLMSIINFRKLKATLAIWSLLFMALTAALHDFFIKLATFQIPELNGAAINSVVIGLVILLSLTKESFRIGFKKEFKNFKFALVSEFFSILAIIFTYLAMKGLSATIFSVIGTTQPLFVLLFEFVAFSFGIKMVKDFDWRNKIISIFLIVMGIVILYLNQ